MPMPTRVDRGGKTQAMLNRLSSEWAYLRGFLRALRATDPIAKNPSRTIRDLAEDAARRHRDRVALISERETLTYRQWNGRANLYARWALAQGFAKGDVVALLMPNRPEYLCIWLGLAKAGVITALLNTNLPGNSLARLILSVDCRAIIVDAALIGHFEATMRHLDRAPQIFVHGDCNDGPAHDHRRVDEELAGFSDADIPTKQRVALTLSDPCLYIFTSGTTGLPKAANVNHYRVQLAMLGFAAVTRATAEDCIYDALPMYHTVGGLCTPGAALMVGGTCVIRERFSAHDFWTDIVAHGCTMFAYVGELCRYLLAMPAGPCDRAHKIRLCIGNGLRPDIWTTFARRFDLAHILEFYAATEGNITLFNFDQRPGTIGRIPPCMERKFIVKIVRFDTASEAPLRDAAGRCIECAPGETGEAIGQILDDAAHPTSRFDGYSQKAANETKILHDVFQAGDRWFRSGDLMRRDARGYFYFVDRTGDTFRWKGENVSTTEVAEAISAFPGVREAMVYGVAVAGTEGRAGMAALVIADPSDFALDCFQAHLAAQLPEYAQPLFLRFEASLPMTSTFKPRKIELVADGFDPDRIAGPVFFNDQEQKRFLRMDRSLHRQIVSGEKRL
jgi:fatty-acyl-CoA synthase